MPRVAVEGALTPVREALEQNGYEVVHLDPQTLTQVDCVVITGMDDNVMGMQDIQTKAQVITAEGKTAEQVMKEVEQRLIKH